MPFQHRILTSATALFLTAAPALLAVDIDWGTTPLQTNTQSDGVTPVDDSFVFYLGWFDDDNAWPGPSSTNTAEWMDHWHPVDISAFSGSPLNRFGGSHTVGSGDPPPNTKGYLFGVKRQCTNGEWILLTNDSTLASDSFSDDDWLWPDAAGGIGPGDNADWTVNSASVAILGQRIIVTPVPLVTRFQTASVGATPPVPMPGTLWQELTFTPTQLADPNVSGWDADPNQNGRTNLLEFALDTSPLISEFDDNLIPTIIETGGQKYLGLIVNKSHDAQVTLQGSVSATLTPDSWNPGPPHVLIHDQSCSQIIFRDATPINTATVRCLRLDVTLP